MAGKDGMAGGMGWQEKGDMIGRRKKKKQGRLNREGLNRASLTVEAALVLPVFIFAIVVFLYYFQIMRLQDQLHFALTETAKEASGYAFMYEDISHGKGAGSSSDAGTNSGANADSDDNGSGIGRGGGVAFYQLKVRSYLTSGIWDNSCVVGGKNGVLLLESDYMEDGKQMHLTASYLVRPVLPFSFGYLKKYTQEVYTEGFVGTAELVSEQDGNTDSDHQDKELVYVTKYGTVYHENASCSHIKLSIQSISGAALDSARNSGGGKYGACDKCAKKVTVTSGGTYYITKEGDCYHVGADCSGLKRLTGTMPKEEAIQKGYRPCSGCAG